MRERPRVRPRREANVLPVSVIDGTPIHIASHVVLSPLNGNGSSATSARLNVSKHLWRDCGSTRCSLWLSIPNRSSRRGI